MSMATRKHIKANCPFCSWCRRSFLLPDHLIIHHVTELSIRPITTDHCVYTRILNKKDEFCFCICLTCRKGVMGDGISGNSARWVDLHSKQSECKKFHKERLLSLKQTIAAAQGHVPAAKPTLTESSVVSLWKRLRELPRYSSIMMEIETLNKDLYDDSSDSEDLYIFDAAIGFEDFIKAAIGAKKELNNCSSEKSKIEEHHETMLMEMRDESRNMQLQIRNLLSENKLQAYQLSELSSRVSTLERENNRYKSKYPVLNEDPTA